MLDQGPMESDLDRTQSQDRRHGGQKCRWPRVGEACPISQHPAVWSAWSRLQGGVGGSEASAQANWPATIAL